MTKHQSNEREDFEAWLSNYVGAPLESLAEIRTDDPDEPYFHEDYDEEALKLIIIAWQAWLARSSHEEADDE